MLNVKLEENLSQRKNNFLHRDHHLLASNADIKFAVNGNNYLSFSSNNYLGLANHPVVVAACTKALQKFGVGSGSAYLICGYSSAHQALEEALADFLNYPDVLVFSCGYMANLGVLGGLFTKGDIIFADKLNHASLIDGALATKANLKRYPHCNEHILEKLCQEHSHYLGNKLIITEGVFGMDGTIAPLKSISTLAAKHNALWLLDDTHGLGVLGSNGSGSQALHELSNYATILTGSFGKAFGTYGAFVASSPLIIESLKQFARTYLYTTAIPPAIAAATLASLELIQTEHWRREKLQQTINYFRECAEQLGLPLTQSQTAIQPIILGNSEAAINVSERLKEKGIIVKAIRPPTVPNDSARIRITLTTQHDKTDIDYLMENLVNAIKSP